MADSTKKSNKKLIVGICVAIVAVIIIVVTIIFLNLNRPLDDSFFVSDGSKLVLTLSSDDVDMEDPEYNPVKTHIVYFYSGETITNLKAYYEYENQEAATAAADYIKEHYIEDEYAKIEVSGKYAIFTTNQENFQDLTTSEVKEQIEFMQSL